MAAVFDSRRRWFETLCQRGLSLDAVEFFAVLVAAVPPRSGFRLVLVLAAFAGTATPSVTSGDDDGARPAAPAAPTASGDDSAVADETGTDSPVADPVLPPPRFCHPQPNLRHATPRYDASFAMPPADATLLRRLEEPLPEGGIRLAENATVLDLQDWLSQRAKVPARIEWQAFEDMGLDAETPLPTNHVENGATRAALRELLDDIDLTVIVKHGSLVITSQENAAEHLVVGFYPFPTQLDGGNVQPLVEMIHATVAADTWDVVGGPGAIRVAEEANALAISHTQAVHAEILAFMRTGFDADLATDGDRKAGQIPTRVHRVRDAALAAELEARLVVLCNGALGPAGDPDAQVSRIGGDRLVVQSASRAFQIYAAELVRSLDGVVGQPWNSYPAVEGFGGPAPPGGQ